MTVLADRPTAVGGGLLLLDLLLSGTAVRDHLRSCVESGQWLDAYLLAAGLDQLVADALHPDPWSMRRAAAHLGQGSAAAGRWAGQLAGLGADLLELQSRRNLRHTGLEETALRTGELTSLLAEVVMEPGLDDSLLRERLEPLVPPFLPPMVSNDVVRLPACFRSFDQHPADLHWLAEAFLERYPGRADRPVCVVGVRTSGSYLAPLLSAALRLRCRRFVETLTVRPGRPLRPSELATVDGVLRAGGQFVVTDDPPGSGSSLAAVVAPLRARGAGGDGTVVAVPVFGDRLPAALDQVSAVVQPWSSWTVHQRLAPACVAAALHELLGDAWRVGSPRPLGEPTGPRRRGHARAVVTVPVTDVATGTTTIRTIVAEGAGLGYLGRHAVAVAERLPDHVGRVIGHRDGLLLRDWVEGFAQAHRAAPSEVVDYVVARRRALTVDVDPTPRLAGRDPVWEVAATVISGGFGPLATTARLGLLGPLTRRLLVAEGPASVVDGSTGPQSWFRAGPDGSRPVKADFHQKAFSNLEGACYDARFDLAGAALEPGNAELSRALREGYLARTGDAVDDERWLLHRWVHLWRSARAGEETSPEAARRVAAVVHDYLVSQYLADLPPVDPADDSPVVALDLDGVLESDPLGVPITTPTGAVCLRALRAHGLRTVLVTGRSLVDARDRCTAFGLAGAVAEYGSVLHDQRTGDVVDLRSAEQMAWTDGVRLAALAEPGVVVDPGHRYVVRLIRTSGGPSYEVVRRIVGDASVDVVRGEGQDDLVPRGVDKGTGLRVLLDRLGAEAAALAVGDSAADLSMFRESRRSWTPRNAERSLSGPGVRRARGAYQTGLAQAVADLIGHRPGGCRVCRVPEGADRSRALLGVLDLRSDGFRSVPLGTVRIGMTLLRGAR